MTFRHGAVFALVLAAGSAGRFGANKLLQSLGDGPLLKRALLAANAAFGGRVVLVTGPDATRVSDAAAGLTDRVVLNPDYAAGIGTSIATGVRACRADSDAIVVMLADQPLVTADHLHALEDEWGGKPGRIVASAYAGTNGPPALFGSTHFDALSLLSGDRGARAVVETNAQAVVTVAFEPASIDIDTPSDLEAVASRLSRSQK